MLCLLRLKENFYNQGNGNRVPYDREKGLWGRDRGNGKGPEEVEIEVKVKVKVCLICMSSLVKRSILLIF